MSDFFKIRNLTFGCHLKEKLLTLGLMLSIFFLLFFRNTRIFIYPEPWIEDMCVFIAEEYKIGFPNTAIVDHAGYLHLFPRIIAWFSMKFGMSNVMIIMNWTVLIIKVLIFYSIYSSKEISSRLLKFSLLAYLVLLPCCNEVYNNVTNLQWWLIPLMAVVITKHESGILMFVFDIGLLIITGLTGVNSIMFAVPCVYLFFKTKSKASFIKGLTVIACALVQLYYIHATSSRMGGMKAVWGGEDVIHLFANRVIYRTLFDFCLKSYLNYFVVLLFIAMLALNLYYYRNQIILWFIFIFAVIYSVTIFYNFINWLPNLNFISGIMHERYFVFLRICTFVLFVSTLNIFYKSVFSFKKYKIFMSYSCYLLMAALLIHYHVGFPFIYQYHADIEQFESAKEGESVIIRFPPDGKVWKTELVKK